jgi:hypothetical protein
MQWKCAQNPGCGAMNAEFVEIDPPVTAAEVRAVTRKVNRLVAQAVRLEMARDGLPPALAGTDPYLMPVDRILKRWAVSIGNGMPSDTWDDRHECSVPPLDDPTAVIVDQVIMHSPNRIRWLVRRWYKSPDSSTTIAEFLRVSRSGLYLEWRAALGYLRGRFEATCDKTLLSILNAVA